MTEDMKLKVRLAAIFWQLGYYTRLELKLAGYSAERSAAVELTDLDVLAVRVSPDLSTDFQVGDCTTRRSIVRSPIQRVFWLKGVMEFFGADRGYLCVASRDPIPEVQRIVAASLGVTISNEENLQRLEDRVLSGRLALKSRSVDAWQYCEGNLATLPKEIGKVLEFRKYKYWLTPAHDRIHALTYILKIHRPHFEKPTKFLKALAVDLLSLFGLAVIQMSSYALRVNPENPESELKSYFYGGYTEMKRREGIAANLQRLFASLRQSSPQQASLFADQKDLNGFRLDPEYLPRLFDTAFRILNRPHDASQILRYLQCVLFEKVLYGTENKEGLEYLNNNFTNLTAKLCRDLAKLLSDASELPLAIFEDV